MWNSTEQSHISEDCPDHRQNMSVSLNDLIFHISETFSYKTQAEFHKIMGH